MHVIADDVVQELSKNKLMFMVVLTHYVLLKLSF